MSDKNDKNDKGSFWTTIPGCLTGIAAVITAIGGLITVLFAVGILRLPTSPTLAPPAETRVPPTEAPVPSTPTTVPSTTSLATPFVSNTGDITSVATPLPALVLPTTTLTLTPRFYAFMACARPCDGTNSTRAFPERITKLHLQWRYENVPVGTHYVRAWTMTGQEWVRYDCTWPGPATGIDNVTLSEPDGLHSGVWEVTIALDGVVYMREQVIVEGNWTFWSPAGVFGTCYGNP